MQSVSQFSVNKKCAIQFNIQLVYKIIKHANAFVFLFKQLNALKHLFLAHGLNNLALPRYQALFNLMNEDRNYV